MLDMELIVTVQKTALVTGATSGIGRATSLTLLRLGHVVYGAGRRTDRLAELAELGVRPVNMDVTDEESMRSGVARILEESGRIDVLVNNAGYGSYGAVEDVPLEEARRQFDIAPTHELVAQACGGSSCLRFHNHHVAVLGHEHVVLQVRAVSPPSSRVAA